MNTQKAEELLDRAEEKPFRMLGANLVLLEGTVLTYDSDDPANDSGVCYP